MKRKPPSSKLVQEIARRFTYHAPEGDQAARYQQIRSLVGSLAQELARLCPEGREFALSLTHLDEVVFWANASIARAMPEEPNDDSSY
jgi:hypothetical protein